MQTYSNCFPCFFRATQETVGFLNLDDSIKIEIYKIVARKISKFSLNATPPEMGYYIHKIIRDVAKNSDPYKKMKKRYNDLALSIYEKIKTDIFYNNNPLYEAIKFAIAGNLIDFGVTIQFDFHELLEQIHSIDLNLTDFNAFENKLKHTKRILYLGDNSGEIVFDKMLIELLQTLYNKKITYVVRGAPIINDVTMEDAKYVGMDGICSVISNGSGYPGTILSKTSKIFKKEFYGSDLIIAKGQGNYESLSDEKAPLVFLLMAKCEIVARDLKVEINSFNIKLQEYD